MYRVIWSKIIGIYKGGGWIKFRGIFSRRNGIDSYGGGYIRFRDNMVRSIGRDGGYTLWVSFRGNSGQVEGTVVVFGRTAGAKVVVVAVGTGAGST